MTQVVDLPDSIQKAISKPLPPAALKKHPIKSHLTVINAAFLMQRLDNCFGVGGWSVTDSGITWINTPIQKKDPKGQWFAQQIINGDGVPEAMTELFAFTQVTLTIVEYGIVFTAYGASSNTDPGDSAKGAVTDGFTSCCKLLGIGRHIWMNQDTAGVPETRSVADEKDDVAAKMVKGGPHVISQSQPDSVKIATDFMSNYTIRTVADLNDALQGIKKSEMSDESKRAAAIILSGHAKKIGAGYDKTNEEYRKTAITP